MHKPSPDFQLSRAGWELYHLPRRYPRANYPAVEPERITKAEYLAEQATAAATALPTQQQQEQTMRGMQRLANLAQTITQEIDAEANAAADKLVAAKQNAKSAIGKFHEHAGAIQKVADDVVAQLGQISNMPPTDGSQG